VSNAFPGVFGSSFTCTFWTPSAFVLNRHLVSSRKGGGLVDATGRWLVGAKGDYPF
jgi:hypothetical protein